MLGSAVREADSSSGYVQRLLAELEPQYVGPAISITERFEAIGGVMKY